MRSFFLRLAPPPASAPSCCGTCLREGEDARDALALALALSTVCSSMGSILGTSFAVAKSMAGCVGWQLNSLAGTSEPTERMPSASHEEVLEHRKKTGHNNCGATCGSAEFRLKAKGQADCLPQHEVVVLGSVAPPSVLFRDERPPRKSTGYFAVSGLAPRVSYVRVLTPRSAKPSQPKLRR